MPKPVLVVVTLAFHLESFDDSASFDVDNVGRAVAFAVVMVVLVVAVVIVVAAVVIVVGVEAAFVAIVEAVAAVSGAVVVVVEANVGDCDVVSVVDALKLIENRNRKSHFQN